MSDRTPPGTLFGLPLGLHRQEAERLARFLTLAWHTQTGTWPHRLERDLESLREFFDPVAQGARLRRRLAAIDALPSDPPGILPVTVFLPLDRRRGLITPEGRIALACIEHFGGEDDRIVLDLGTVAWANDLLAATYRTWVRKRLNDIITADSRLQLPIIGLVCALLVNGSIGKDHGLPIPKDEEEEAALSAILEPLVDAFVTVLKPQRKPTEAFRLRGGWVLTEATRHLFGLVHHEGGSIWIDRAKEPELVERLASQLARHNTVSESKASAALKELVERYHLERPRLAARRLAHERPAHTEAVVNRLLAGFAQSQAADRGS